MSCLCPALKGAAIAAFGVQCYVSGAMKRIFLDLHKSVED